MHAPDHLAPGCSCDCPDCQAAGAHSRHHVPSEPVAPLLEELGRIGPRNPDAADDAAASHGPWCVQSGSGDSATPFVHGDTCYRSNEPSEAARAAVPELTARYQGRDRYGEWWTAELARLGAAEWRVRRRPHGTREEEIPELERRAMDGDR
jgi:hypothetical protein